MGKLESCWLSLSVPCLFRRQALTTPFLLRQTDLSSLPLCIFLKWQLSASLLSPPLCSSFSLPSLLAPTLFFNKTSYSVSLCMTYYGSYPLCSPTCRGPCQGQSRQNLSVCMCVYMIHVVCVWYMYLVCVWRFSAWVYVLNGMYACVCDIRCVVYTWYVCGICVMCVVCVCMWFVLMCVVYVLW